MTLKQKSLRCIASLQSQLIYLAAEIALSAYRGMCEYQAELVDMARIALVRFMSFGQALWDLCGCQAEFSDIAKIRPSKLNYQILIPARTNFDDLQNL